MGGVPSPLKNKADNTQLQSPAELKLIMYKDRNEKDLIIARLSQNVANYLVVMLENVISKLACTRSLICSFWQYFSVDQLLASLREHVFLETLHVLVAIVIGQTHHRLIA